MKIDIKLLSIVTITLLLNACGSGDSVVTENSADTLNVPSIEGKLVDAPVAGATYMCGEVTQRTGSDGSFICNTYPVRFYAGGVALGEIYTLAEDGFVTPQDLLGVQRDNYEAPVGNMALFLQSLDDDGDIERIITLDETLIQKLKEKQLDIQTMSHTALIELLNEIGAINSVSQEEALEHLRAHMPEHTLLVTQPEETPNEGNDSSSSLPTESDPETPTETPVTQTEVETPDSDNNTSEENTTVTETQIQTLYLDQINDARAEGRECGEYGYFPAVDPIVWSDQLYRASLEHSKDMAISNTFSHTGSGTDSDETAEVLHSGTGSSVSERIEHNGYTNWRRYGENIAAGTSMDESIEAIEGWLESPGHCKNIMKAEFKEVGMAVYYNETSHYKYYWTQDFGSK